MNTESNTPTSVVNVERLLQHVGSDLRLLDELYTLFLEYYPKHMAETREAIAGKQCSLVSDRAHELRSALSNFFAPTADELAVQLERNARRGQMDGVEELCDRLDDEIKQMIVEVAKACEDHQDQLAAGARGISAFL